MLAFALGLVVLARLTSSPSRPVAAPSGAALPSVAPLAPLPTNPNECRTGVACTTVRRAPDQTYRAVLAAFPAATGRDATTVIADDGVHAPILWFRVVQSGTEKLDITVRISQPRSSDRLTETREPDGIGRVVSTETLRSHGLQVELVVTSNDAASPPSFATMRALAADRRLIALQ